MHYSLTTADKLGLLIKPKEECRYGGCAIFEHPDDEWLITLGPVRPINATFAGPVWSAVRYLGDLRSSEISRTN